MPWTRLHILPSNALLTHSIPHRPSECDPPPINRWCTEVMLHARIRDNWRCYVLCSVFVAQKTRRKFYWNHLYKLLVLLIAFKAQNPSSIVNLSSIFTDINTLAKTSDLTVRTQIYIKILLVQEKDFTSRPFQQVPLWLEWSMWHQAAWSKQNTS